MTDCDKAYSEYGGKSVTSASIEGAFSGIAGLVGAGGFWNPVDDDSIKAATNDFDNVQQEWSGIASEEQGAILESQKLFAQRQTELQQEIAKYTTELLQDEIQTNTLFIQILFGIIIIILIYLIVL